MTIVADFRAGKGAVRGAYWPDALACNFYDCGGLDERMSVVNGNIFNSKGVHVGIVVDDAVFGLKGQKLYDLKGSNIYKLNGDLIGHFPDAPGEKKRLDKATDKLFPEG
jgi:hypothetical protein